MKNTQDQNRYAFFDVDGTLISIKSMFDFRRYCLGRLQMYSGLVGILRYCYHDLKHKLLDHLGVRREVLNTLYYKNFRGTDRSEILKLISEWYRDISKTHNFYLKDTLDILNEHRKQGVKTVLVSGSFDDLLTPISQHLKIDHCLSTDLEIKDGEYTGTIIPPQTIGAGKAEAIHAFAASHKINLGRCYAYGDDVSDIPMLKIVGSPVVVSSNPDLIKFASLNDWKIITVDQRN